MPPFQSKNKESHECSHVDDTHLLYFFFNAANRYGTPICYLLENNYEWETNKMTMNYIGQDITNVESAKKEYYFQYAGKLKLMFYFIWSWSQSF